MFSDRTEKIAEQLREAASTGSKTHVIYETGKWVVFKERAFKASAIFSTRQGAVNAAMKVLRSGEAEALVIHKKDGSIAQVRVA